MKIKTNFGILKIKAVSLPNVRLILKRNKGKANAVIAQKKPVFYLYENKAKKGKGKSNVGYMELYGSPRCGTQKS